MKDSSLSVRVAESRDVEILWCWANEPSVRLNSFSPFPISSQKHKEWFFQKTKYKGSVIYIVELSGEPVAQVRYDRTDVKAAEIDVSVAFEHRGRGLGATALIMTRGIALTDIGVDYVIGVVKEDNTASCVSFKKAGFVEDTKRIILGNRCKTFIWPTDSGPEHELLSE